jgi:hypothetical protein
MYGPFLILKGGYLSDQKTYLSRIGKKVKELEKEAVMRKQAEEMPRESEERSSTFMDSSTDFFSIWDIALGWMLAAVAGIMVFISLNELILCEFGLSY